MELRATGTVSIRIAQNAEENSPPRCKIAFTPDKKHSYSFAGNRYALFVSTKSGDACTKARMYELSKNGSVELRARGDWSELLQIAAQNTNVEIVVCASKCKSNPSVRAVTIPAPAH